MKIEDIDVSKTLENARAMLEKETNISSSFKAVLEILFVVITLLINRLGLNSNNSSKPPGTDPNRLKKKKENISGKKIGGQLGHVGKNLNRIADPDEIITILLDEKTLPLGDYKDAGYVPRQVINIRVSRHVTEHRAQILENADGERFVARFPTGITRPVQYGSDLKAHAVYLSQFQLLPYNRVDDYFAEEINIPVSAGSIYNFNKQAFELLEKFDGMAKQNLIAATVLNVDETGINVNGKRAWLHVTANDKWTYFYPHEKRGTEAMNDIGILPFFTGTLCHDHWKPYFTYRCLHSLCNAHHIRELQRAFEQDSQQWALDMRNLLLEINTETKNSGHKLGENEIENYFEKYNAIIAAGEKECPAPVVALSVDGKKKRGKLKKSKSRNLLERLSGFINDTLRFMEEVDVPFTNNLAENNLRMTKVQQKISGCFRSMKGAYIFCRIRSYISTCRKHDISVPEALKMLFRGEMPNFRL